LNSFQIAVQPFMLSSVKPHWEAELKTIIALVCGFWNCENLTVPPEMFSALRSKNVPGTLSSLSKPPMNTKSSRILVWVRFIMIAKSTPVMKTEAHKSKQNFEGFILRSFRNRKIKITIQSVSWIRFKKFEESFFQPNVLNWDP
jgi:hypothetical protein